MNRATTITTIIAAAGGTALALSGPQGFGQPGGQPGQFGGVSDTGGIGQLGDIEIELPETIEMTGVIRDFRESHPDMQYKVSGVMTGLVLADLDEDGKPVLDPGFYDTLSSSQKSKYPINSQESFAQWFRDVPGVNTSWLHSITLELQEDGSYFFAQEKPNYFFPADYKGFSSDGSEMKTVSTGTHNFYFTYELETEFTYTHPDTRDHDLTFTFTGDDDVWVFINGKLACDIGGVHGQATTSVNLDDRAAELGLAFEQNYKLKLFFAERHTTESNFRIETTLNLRKAQLPPTAGLHD